MLLTLLLACGAIVWLSVDEVAANTASTKAGSAFARARSLLASVVDEKSSPAPSLRGAAARSLGQYSGYDEDDFGRLYGVRKKEKAKGSSTNMYISQTIFGIVFYFLVSSKYPQLESSNSGSAAIMNEPVVCRINAGPTCLQSFFCQNPMLAHLMHSTGILNYWVALLLSMCFPCCTLFGAIHCAEMDQKLGGSPKGLLYNLFETICCACCLIAQSNEALDAATDSQLGCCSVVSREPSGEIAVAYQVLPPSAPPALPTMSAQALRQS